MRLISTVVLLMMCGLSDLSAHAIYISVVEIETNQVRVKVFQDDFQDALRNFGRGTVDSPGSPCEISSTLMAQYFEDNLKIEVNGAAMVLSFEDCSVEGDSYWITFGINAPESWQSIRVEDRHFMEMFPTQSNIIKVAAPKQHFCRLSRAEPACTLEF